MSTEPLHPDYQAAHDLVVKTWGEIRASDNPMGPHPMGSPEFKIWQDGYRNGYASERNMWRHFAGVKYPQDVGEIRRREAALRSPDRLVALRDAAMAHGRVNYVNGFGFTCTCGHRLGEYTLGDSILTVHNAHQLDAMKEAVK